MLPRLFHSAIFRLLLTVLALYIYSPLFTASILAWDVSSKVEQVGNPSRPRWQDANTACRYARNVWDLQSFNGKLYVGSGNSSNAAPCQNAGPVNIAAYNVAPNAFYNEAVVAGEQIDNFKVINNQLVIPGHDRRGGDWSLDNWYRLEGTSWVEHLNLPDFVHNYDIEEFQGKLFAGGSIQIYDTSPIQISADNGITWASSTFKSPFRMYAFLKLPGRLFATFGWSPTPDTLPTIYEYTGNGNFQYYQLVYFDKMFPQTSKTGVTLGKINRSLLVGNTLVYIGANAVNDHQSDPFGVYKLTSIQPTTTDASKITLPPNAKPWDLLQANGKTYILGSVPNGNRFWVTVTSSTDLITWREEFRFDAPTFARSFEQLNGDWYFGLGTDTTALSINTGDILRIKPSLLGFRPGDINKDGFVNIIDYVYLFEQYGQPGTQAADINSDNTVNILDYTLLFENYGL